MRKSTKKMIFWSFISSIIVFLIFRKRKNDDGVEVSTDENESSGSTPDWWDYSTPDFSGSSSSHVDQYIDDYEDSLITDDFSTLPNEIIIPEPDNSNFIP